MYVVYRSLDLFIIEHLSKAEAHILALQSLNLPFKYKITSLFLYPLLLGAPLPLGALRVRVVCLWVNPALHPCNILRDNRRGVSRGNKNVGCRT